MSLRIHSDILGSPLWIYCLANDEVSIQGLVLEYTSLHHFHINRSLKIKQNYQVTHNQILLRQNTYLFISTFNCSKETYLSL